MRRELISAKELAKELNLEIGTIYEATKRGNITNYGVGRKKRYDLNEILKLKK